MKHYERKFIDLPKNDERVAYLEVGKGDKTLLLIHGNMSSSIHYTPLLELLENDFHIYVPDMKGYGESTYNHPFTHLDQQADLIAEFCDLLGLKDIPVGGWSTGGGVAMSLCARYPGIVNKIIFFDSISHRGHPYFKRGDDGKPMFGVPYSSMEEMAGHSVQAATIAWMNEKNYEKMTGVWNLVIYTGGIRPSEEDNRILMDETFKERCLGESYWALSTFNIDDTASYYAPGNGLCHNVTVPILCFWGENDISIPWFNTHELPDYFGDQLKLVKLPNCGHSCLNDQPELLAKNIREFLA